MDDYYVVVVVVAAIISSSLSRSLSASCSRYSIKDLLMDEVECIYVCMFEAVMSQWLPSKGTCTTIKVKEFEN